MSDTIKYLRKAIRNYGIDGYWVQGPGDYLVLKDWKSKAVTAKLRLFWLGPVSSGFRFSSPEELFVTGLWDAWGNWQAPLNEIWDDVYNDACPKTYLILMAYESDGPNTRCYEMLHGNIKEVKPAPPMTWKPISTPPTDKTEYRSWQKAQRREWLIEKYVGDVSYLDDEAKELLNRFADPTDPEYGGLTNLKRNWNRDPETLTATMLALKNGTPIYV